jgi:hypothetical protein
VFYHAGVYFAAPEILHRAERGGVMDVELAISRDGVNFTRPFRREFWLGKNADAKAFDGGSLMTNASRIVLEDEIRFYYGGYSGGATGGDDYHMTTGIGLATMRRDRFAGVHAVENVGQVTMKPVELAGVRRVMVNADASRGLVAGELLDGEGYRVRGFTRQEAVPITTDAIRHELGWKERRLTDLPRGRYHLRLHLRGEAEVFAVTLDRGEASKG